MAVTFTSSKSYERKYKLRTEGIRITLYLIIYLFVICVTGGSPGAYVGAVYRGSSLYVYGGVVDVDCYTPSAIHTL